MRFQYTTHTRVAKIEERFRTVYLSGIGADAEMGRKSTGWWIVSEGPSPMAMLVGDERPIFDVGSVMRVTFEVHVPWET